MPESLSDYLTKVGANIQRQLDCSEYRGAYFARCYADLYDKVKREAPELLTHAEGTASLYANYVRSGTPIDVRLIIDSAEPDPVRVEMPANVIPITRPGGGR